jgi:hypothetical protein
MLTVARAGQDPARLLVIQRYQFGGHRFPHFCTVPVRSGAHVLCGLLSQFCASNGTEARPKHPCIDSDGFIEVDPHYATPRDRFSHRLNDTFATLRKGAKTHILIVMSSKAPLSEMFVENVNCNDHVTWWGPRELLCHRVHSARKIMPIRNQEA